MLLPVITQKPALTVVGIEAPFISAMSPDANNAKVIGPLWGMFGPRVKEVPHRVGHDMVGVMYFKPKEQRAHPHEVQYIAASFVSRVPQPHELPAGMTTYTVPAATFAVFTHRGPITGLGATLDAVYKEWLPQSPYRHSGVADIEIYGRKFIHDGPDSEMEYWISIERKAEQPCA